MKTLLILRHAKSDWSEEARDDHDRPLNARGKRDAPRIGRLLADEGLLPDHIISSTAKRARRTAKKVAAAAGFDGPLELTAALYLAAPEQYLAALRGVAEPEQTVMVVGHNPGLESLLQLLTGNPERLPTAALAQVELPIATWSQLAADTRGKLIRLWRPREMS